MQKTIILFGFTLFFLSSTAQNTSDRYAIVKDESHLLWHGFYFPGGGHHGALQITTGSLESSAKGLKGDFIIDMNSITNKDLKEDDGRKDLENHLRSADFFDTEKFPNGFFSLIRTTAMQKDNYTITGYLTLKGVTREISFPATMIAEKEKLFVKGETTIDRTKWGINHNSKTIFSELKDGIISDDVKVTFDLVLRKIY